MHVISRYFINDVQAHEVVKGIIVIWITWKEVPQALKNSQGENKNIKLSIPQSHSFILHSLILFDSLSLSLPQFL